MLRWYQNELYVGRLYVGTVARIVPEGWRDFHIYKRLDDDEVPEVIRQNTEAMRAHHEKHEAKPWRGWLMFNEDGEPVGYWATEEDAKREMLFLAENAMKEQEQGNGSD